MSEYKSLSTANLPDPAIDPAKGENPTDYFNTVLYTGTSDDSAKVITGVGFQPDFIWSKGRSGTYAVRNHFLRDAVRGANKNLHSNTTDAEASDSGNSFDVDGVTLSSDYGQNGLNTNHVLWSWKAGTSFSNDASATGVGTIDSTGSVSTEAGFSIISYTGTGSSGTIAHGLGVAPSWFFVKNRTDGDASGNTAGNWIVYHQSLSTNQWLKLETTDSVFTNADAFGGSPSSTTIQLGTFNSTNGSGDNMICYAFSEKEGYSKFGSFEGNGDTGSGGPFIYTGFRPAWVMIKPADEGRDWRMYDNKRDVDNRAENPLQANTTATEADESSTGGVDLLSNGFKVRTDNAVIFNSNGNTMIYMAFAEQPFKFSNAR
jgi:hypothetical protein